ncbi:MAG: iron-sulfur cluster repair di-iron protein [Geobacteraceae bacterium]|nr:iron-sulfur cluster repair di-iron protein [Geobacteraceae bacterium]NTW79313.1 iron-sulfur cluster repair di-iron protein [Geobacteraceae bacterium]
MKSVVIGEITIGAIVADDFRAATIFERHGIDFCCGGKIPLAEACKSKGIELDALKSELESLQHEPVDRSQNYSSWSLSFLADYIVNTHHVYLKENDDQIVAYARKIASVHGERHPEVIRIAVLFEKIATDMVAHLKEEEEVFFPALKRAEAARTSGNQPDARDRETIRDSLVRLHREHEEVGDAIHEIRRLANGFRIPEGVCNTFMLTYRKLDEFEEDLHKHVHLENNILFLKATQL